jgi:hypothetical protein
MLIIPPSVLFGAVYLSFAMPGDFGSRGKGHPWFFQARKILKMAHFKRFLRHLSISFLLRTVCFPAAAYPVGINSAATQHTMLPNNRRVKWLPASINAPPVFTNRCCKLVRDQFSILFGSTAIKRTSLGNTVETP